MKKDFICSRVYIFRVFFLMSLCILVGCGGGGGDSAPAADPSTAHIPVISNLQYSPQTITQNQSEASVLVTGTINFTDQGRDITTLVIKTYNANNQLLSTDNFPVPSASGIVSGTISLTVSIDTSIVANYSFEVYVIDGEWSGSNTLSGTFSVTAPTPHGYTGDFLSWTGATGTSHFFKLVRVNGQTGAVTNIGGFNYFPAIKYAADGTLYGFSKELHIINPVNGSTVKIGTFQYQGATLLMHGATFSPTGTLYVVENANPSRVFTVNLTNAALTYVGTPAALMWDLEFAQNATLYSALFDLFTLNASNMSTVSKVGSLGGGIVTALTFGKGGMLFGLDALSRYIYSLNLSTGRATNVIVPGSINLQALVAERTPTKASKDLFIEAAGLYGFSSPQSTETLIDREQEIMAARNLFEVRHEMSN